MNLQFQKWLNVTVNHNYFEESVCDVLAFAPTPGTKRLMARYNFLSKNYKNQFSIHYGANQENAVSVKDILKELDRLTFYILSNDPNFIKYSNLSYPLQQETVYGFYNGVNTAVPTALQSLSYVSTADLRTSQLLVFTHALPAAEAVLLEVKDILGAIMYTQQLNGLQAKTCQVDLTKFGEGFYSVWINGAQQSSCFVSGEELPDNCIGVVELATQTLIPLLATTGELDFTIDFEARSTYWKYSILLAQNKQIRIKEMTIENSSTIEYNGPVQENKMGGAEASVYTSKKPWPLSRKMAKMQSLKIMYYNNFSDRLNDMEFTLPAPDVSQLTTMKNSADETVFVSPRIIYI